MYVSKTGTPVLEGLEGREVEADRCSERYRGWCRHDEKIEDGDVDANVEQDENDLALTSRTACRAAFMASSQPFPLNHDPLVANVNKHFKFFNNLVLLHQLGLEIVNLLLLLFFHLLQVLARLGQLPSQV